MKFLTSYLVLISTMAVLGSSSIIPNRYPLAPIPIIPDGDQFAKDFTTDYYADLDNLNALGEKFLHKYFGTDSSFVVDNVSFDNPSKNVVGLISALIPPKKVHLTVPTFVKSQPLPKLGVLIINVAGTFSVKDGEKVESSGVFTQVIILKNRPIEIGKGVYIAETILSVKQIQ